MRVLCYLIKTTFGVNVILSPFCAIFAQRYNFFRTYASFMAEIEFVSVIFVRFGTKNRHFFVSLISRSSLAHRSGGVNCSDCTILGLFSVHGPVMVLFLSSHSLGTIITYPHIRSERLVLISSFDLLPKTKKR